ncbi:unnamed protein product [Eruca vesicaria subsp. sativa]|uniref:Uncharacterized protein n=1 Tax=Eruca vesicaria subsp. sativa TaxID=29727 RepID=A0ABC8KHY2_ERUVS|nr:unnamed protein product [Eruca vesicaria subsp. sativa]
MATNEKGISYYKCNSFKDDGLHIRHRCVFAMEEELTEVKKEAAEVRKRLCKMEYKISEMREEMKQLKELVKYSQ